MEKVIDRLRKEMNENLMEWLEIGKAKGQEWAKEAHYAELEIVTHAKNYRQAMKKLIEFEPGNGDWFDEEIYRSYPVMKGTKLDAIVQYGFMQGVQDFWNEIKGKI
jgi:hypothetical protein